MPSSTRSPDLSSSPAREERRPPNAVVVIPGVLGSRLVADSDSAAVWGEWKAGFKDPGTGAGSQLFGLPMALGQPLDRLRSRSHVDGTLAVARGSIVGVPVQITAYSSILSALGVESHTDSFSADRRGVEDAPAFEFSYDWRRSLDESAIDFGAFLERVTRFLQVQRQSTEPVRFNVVAHSMGGLLLRYFLQFGSQLLPDDDRGPRLTWGGAAYIDKAIIIGTPNAGSMRMIERLIRGIPANPLHPSYGPVLIGTMPSGYMLLPRARHAPCADGEVDLLDADFWLERDWGITASWLEEERARQMPEIDSPARRLEVAEDHLRKCLRNARVFQAAMDQRIRWMPSNLELHLFLGNRIPTPARFTAAREERGLRWALNEPGDGTVLASSARLDEPNAPAPVPWTSVSTSRSRHLGLLKDRELLSKVLALHSGMAAA